MYNDPIGLSLISLIMITVGLLIFIKGNEMHGDSYDRTFSPGRLVSWIGLVPTILGVVLAAAIIAGAFAKVFIGVAT